MRSWTVRTSPLCRGPPAEIQGLGDPQPAAIEHPCDQVNRITAFNPNRLKKRLSFGDGRRMALLNRTLGPPKRFRVGAEPRNHEPSDYSDLLHLLRSVITGAVATVSADDRRNWALTSPNVWFRRHLDKRQAVAY